MIAGLNQLVQKIADEYGIDVVVDIKNVDEMALAELNQLYITAEMLEFFYKLENVPGHMHEQMYKIIYDLLDELDAADDIIEKYRETMPDLTAGYNLWDGYREIRMRQLFEKINA